MNATDDTSIQLSIRQEMVSEGIKLGYLFCFFRSVVFQEILFRAYAPPDDHFLGYDKFSVLVIPPDEKLDAKRCVFFHVVFE